MAQQAIAHLMPVTALYRLVVLQCLVVHSIAVQPWSIRMEPHNVVNLGAQYSILFQDLLAVPQGSIVRGVSYVRVFYKLNHLVGLAVPLVLARCLYSNA